MYVSSNILQVMIVNAIQYEFRTKLVHSNIIILSSFTHLGVVSDLSDYIFCIRIRR